MQGKSAVRIRRKYVVGVQNQHTAGRQAGSKFFTVAGKKRKKEAARISYQQHAPLFRLVNHASGHGATLRVSLSSGVLLTVPFPRSGLFLCDCPFPAVPLPVRSSCIPLKEARNRPGISGDTPPKKNSRSQSGHDSNTTRADAVLSCMHGAIPRLFLALGTGLVFPVPVPGQCPFPL